jgi:hypothetical protein
MDCGKIILPTTSQHFVALTSRADYCWAAGRSLLGIALLAAATLKAYELFLLPLLGPGLLNERWFLIAEVELEVVFGGWLLLGTAGRSTWAGTVALWIAFLGVATFEAATGAGSCGCFGLVRVNPWYTVSFDLAVILILPFCRPSQTINSSSRYPTWRSGGLGSLIIAGAAFGAWNLYRYSPSRLGMEGLTFADGTVVFEPEKWVGHRFLLTNNIDIGNQFTSSEWIVLLVHHDCDHCATAVPRYVALSTLASAKSPRLAIIEMPPYSTSEELAPWPKTGGVFGKLDKTHDWFAATPVAILLKDGLVQAAKDGENASIPDPSWQEK